MAIEKNDITGAFTRKSQVTKTTVEKEEKKKNPTNPTDEDDVIFTGAFDLSMPELYNPSIEKYKKAKKETGGYSFLSVYMRKEEQNHLEKLAKKYHMSKAAVVRMLVINSK